MTAGFHATDRALLRVSGAEARDFLQNLVTNDLDGLDTGPVYTALLTPQGKYLFDFFVIRDGETMLLDVAADRAEALALRLAMYRLRARVAVEPADLAVVLGTGAVPILPLAFPDPRLPELGWRAYGADPELILAGVAPLDPSALTALRIAHAVPETGIELVPDESYILEMGFERLRGVDFRKGCYVGQEVTARMKHKTELRKGLVRVAVEGEAPPPGAPILRGERQVGTLYTTSGGQGLAHLRFDMAGDGMQAGPARVRQAP